MQWAHQDRRKFDVTHCRNTSRGRAGQRWSHALASVALSFFFKVTNSVGAVWSVWSDRASNNALTMVNRRANSRRRAKFTRNDRRFAHRKTDAFTCTDAATRFPFSFFYINVNSSLICFPVLRPLRYPFSMFMNSFAASCGPFEVLPQRCGCANTALL